MVRSGKAGFWGDMMKDEGLIGRERERAELLRLLSSAREGVGALVLLAGEAGVGKTRLADAALTESGLPAFVGAGVQEGMPAYSPMVSVLRAFLRVAPEGFDGCGPLVPYLALLLPELGRAASGGDPAMLFEAIRAALAQIPRLGPSAVFIDDLQWADQATLELLPPLAGALADEPLLILGAYRSDAIPRGHPLRRMRSELRRLRRLQEIAVEPLSGADTAALADHLLGGPPGPALTAALYDRTEGVPFFVEELARALAESGRLRRGRAGFEVAGETVPIPDTVRDAVLLRTESLSDAARAALEIAAIAGLQADVELLAEIAGNEDGIQQAIAHGFLIEVEPDHVAFRHALVREALYGEVGWSRRRALHSRVASWLEERVAPPSVTAEHWLAARERERARQALLAAATASCAVHAYRDAARTMQQALDFWPDDDEDERLAALDRLGTCAQLSGDLTGAARAWREVVEGRRLSGDTRAAAGTERRLATIYELQGMWERALAARRAAAEGFAAGGLPSEAAAERLAAAGHLQGAGGSFSVALTLAQTALAEAEEAGRIDLVARALGMAGIACAKLGRTEEGVAALRRGLTLALDHDMTSVAAEIYQRLAVALEHATDYARARDIFATATTFCEERGATAMAQFCLACMAVVLHRLGEWDRATAIWRTINADPDAMPASHQIATSLLGVTHALRGETKRARTLLVGAYSRAQRTEFFPSELYCPWGLAIIAARDGDLETAADHCRRLIARWEASEDCHYVIPPLHWATTFFATNQMGADARACAQVMARVAAESGNREALATLAHALGEVALLDGDAEGAVMQFTTAVDLLRRLDLPLERAVSGLRAGAALAAAGAPATAVEQLTDAYRIARRLRVEPLAAQAAQELAALGVAIERRLGRRAAGRLQRAGLTERELETLRLIAVGRTNREIAHELFVSPRTVDMHVRNILTKLGCRSRAEATHRAGHLGLLPSAQTE
jgi:DNA-binding NarL/FixJ family response regulator